MQILKQFLKTPIALGAIFASLLISAPIKAETRNLTTEQQLDLPVLTQLPTQTPSPITIPGTSPIPRPTPLPGETFPPTQEFPPAPQPPTPSIIIQQETIPPGTIEQETIPPEEQFPSPTTQPGTTQPGTTQPGTTQPGITQPGTTQPGITQPGTTQPGITQPGTTQPGLPGTTQPGLPGTTQPGLPGTTQPGLPGTTQPIIPQVQRVPPTPEMRGEPVTEIIPVDSKVDVAVVNRTNADVIYEVIGHTDSRILAAGSETLLEDLPVPVNVTVMGQDDRFVRVIPQETDDETLVIALEAENSPLDNPQGAIEIQADGRVFLD